MALVTSVDILKKACGGGYAVCAFNAENMEMAQAILSGAEEMRAPVIIQTTPSTLKYASPETFAGIVAALAEKTGIPAALHLDHGDSFGLVCAAIKAGYTSVMIDGSRLPYKENAEITRRAVLTAHAFNIPVEGELGTVGGKEDDISGEASYTDPDEALSFTEQTGVDSLAVGIGTAHGFYTSVPKLNLPLLSVLKSKLSIPVVLHGATGLSDEVIRECVRTGVNKINFATELRAAFTAGVRSVLADNSIIDVKQYGKEGRERVKSLVMQKITLSGSSGKA